MPDSERPVVPSGIPPSIPGAVSLHDNGEGTAPISDEFAGWGKVARIQDLPSSEAPQSQLRRSHGLGQVLATAICGNDITSSCLYVAALCAIYAGPYAFLCLAMVALVLYLFRGIYAEVGSALPLNGGAYNALLNTTSKA